MALRNCPAEGGKEEPIDQRLVAIVERLFERCAGHKPMQDPLVALKSQAIIGGLQVSTKAVLFAFAYWSFSMVPELGSC